MALCNRIYVIVLNEKCTYLYLDNLHSLNFHNICVNFFNLSNFTFCTIIYHFRYSSPSQLTYLDTKVHELRIQW